MDFKSLVQKPKSKLELAFFLVATLAAFMFLANLNTKDPTNNAYSLVYLPFLILSIVVFVAAQLKNRIPAASTLSFGDPAKKSLFGLPAPMFSAVAGLMLVLVALAMPTLAWTPFSTFSTVDGEADLVKISLGSGLLEEIFTTGVLMPTLAGIMFFYGLVPGLLMLLFFGFFFGIPLNYFLIIGAVGVFLFILERKKKSSLSVLNNPKPALLAAMLLTALFFTALHERVNAGDAERAFSEFKFSLISQTLALGTGSLSGSVVMHVANNAIALQSSLWWITPAIMLAIFAVYSYGARRVNGVG
jgi:hypothetical protein